MLIKVARQYLDSPFAGLAIPERRLSGLYRPAQLTKSVVDNVLFADPGKDVRPVRRIVGFYPVTTGCP